MAFVVFHPPRGVKGRPLTEPRHGTPSAYKSGCRCAACTKANTDYYRERRKRAIA